MKKSKTTKRESNDFPGLEKSCQLKIRQDVMDQDYIHKLSTKEKKWLNKFNEEYVSNNFNHDGAKLHKSKKLRKKIGDSNNARNRDTHSVAGVKKQLISTEDCVVELNKKSASHVNPEDAMNAIIDYKNMVRLKPRPDSED